MPLSHRKKLAGMAAAATAVAATMTPDARTWWVAGPAWVAAVVFGLRWLLEREPHTEQQQKERQDSRPRPRLLLSAPSDSSVAVENIGDTDAFGIEIGSTQVGDYLLEFSPPLGTVTPDRLPVRQSAIWGVTARAKDGSQILESAIASALRSGARQRWSIPVRYRDFQAKAFETVFDLYRDPLTGEPKLMMLS